MLNWYKTLWPFQREKTWHHLNQLQGILSAQLMLRGSWTMTGQAPVKTHFLQKSFPGKSLIYEAGINMASGRMELTRTAAMLAGYRSNIVFCTHPRSWQKKKKKQDTWKNRLLSSLLAEINSSLSDQKLTRPHKQLRK